MKKVLKLLLIAVLVVATAFSMIACDNGNSSKNGKKGLLYKKISDDTCIIYDYVDEGDKVETLDIGEKLDLPDGVTKVRIKKNAFYGNDTLKTIIVSEKVTEIEAGAFANMQVLETLNIPFVGKLANANVYENSSESAPSEEKAIGSERTLAHLFGIEAYDDGCAVTMNYSSDGTITCYMPVTLKTVIVSNSNGYGIPMCAFSGAVNLENIELVGNINAIGIRAFENTAFETIRIPATVEKIYKEAFAGARVKNVVLDENCNIEVKELAFKGCNLLDKVNSETAKTIDLSKFSSVGTNAFKVGNETIYNVVNPNALDLTKIFDEDNLQK